MKRKDKPIVSRGRRRRCCADKVDACDVCIERLRAWNRAAAARKRAKSALRVMVCFRCLKTHPVGEKHCTLAAEYDPPPMVREEAEELFWSAL